MGFLLIKCQVTSCCSNGDGWLMSPLAAEGGHRAMSAFPFVQFPPIHFVRQSQACIFTAELTLKLCTGTCNNFTRLRALATKPHLRYHGRSCSLLGAPRDTSCSFPVWQQIYLPPFFPPELLGLICASAHQELREGCWHAGGSTLFAEPGGCRLVWQLSSAPLADQRCAKRWGLQKGQCPKPS